jgi:hypothetical protein
MKLVNRKTRKAIEKSVRKAMKKHGPALMATLASSLASSIATLASTTAPGKRDKSNLADIIERAEDSAAGKSRKKSKPRKGEKKRRTPPADEVSTGAIV